MKIQKVIYDNGDESEYNELPLEHFEGLGMKYPHWKFREQKEDWEKKFILKHLEIDLEDWAKDEYDLDDEDKIKSLDDFDDYEIEEEFEERGLGKSSFFYSENILNTNFKDRFFKIIEAGDAHDIDLVLEMMEKKYRIG